MKNKVSMFFCCITSFVIATDKQSLQKIDNQPTYQQRTTQNAKAMRRVEQTLKHLRMISPATRLSSSNIPKCKKQEPYVKCFNPNHLMCWHDMYTFYI